MIALNRAGVSAGEMRISPGMSRDRLVVFDGDVGAFSWGGVFVADDGEIFVDGDGFSDSVLHLPSILGPAFLPKSDAKPVMPLCDMVVLYR